MANATEELLYVFATQGTEKLIKDFKTVATELQLQTKFVNDLAKTQGISKAAAEKLAQVYGVTGATLRKYNEDLKAANKEQLEFAKTQQKAQQASKDLTRQVSDLEKGLIAAGIAGGAFSFLKGVAEDAIAARREYQKLTAALEAVSPNAGADLAFLNKEVDRLSLSLPVAANNFVQLSAAAKGTILEGQGVRDVFSGIAAQGRILGLSNEKQEKAFLALTQSISKGKVQAEELTGQLAEALPGATQKFAAALGVSTAELLKLVKAGQVGLPEIQKFAKFLGEDASKSLANIGDTIETTVAKFDTAVFRLNESIGAKLEPAFKAIANTLTGFIDGFNALPSPVQNAILALGGLSIAIVGVGASIAAFQLLQIGVVFGSIGNIAQSSVASVAALGVAIKGLTFASAVAGVQAFAGSAVAATIAAAPLIAILGTLAAAVAVVSAAIESKRLEQYSEDLAAIGAASQASGNQVFSQLEKFKKLNTEIEKGNGITEAQRKQQEENIKQSEKIVKNADDQIAAIKKLAAERGGLTDGFKDLIQGYESEKKAAQSVLDQQVKVLAGRKEAIKTSGDFADALASANAKVDASLAKQIERIEATAKTEKERLAQTAEAEKNALAQRLANQIDYASKLQQALKTTNDPKEREKLEDAITKSQETQSKLRIDITKKEREQRKVIQDGLIKDLEDAEKLATDAVLTSATARGKELLDLELQIGNTSLEAKSQLRLKDLDNLRANIEDQIKLEQDKIVKLEALQPKLTGDAAEANETKIRAAKQKTAELAGQLVKNEIDQNKAFAEQAAIPYENQAKALQRNLTLLDQQNKLREAGQAVIAAQYDVAVNGAQREIDAVNEGIKLRGELATADGDKRAAILQRLAQLGQQINETEFEAVKKRQVLEDNLARLKQAQLVQLQAADRAALEASLQRVKTELQINAAIAQGNALKLKGKDADANAAVDQANSEIKAQEAIAAKQRESLGISQEGVLKAAEKTEEERKFGQQIDLANAKLSTQKTEIEGVAEKIKSITAEQAKAIAIRKGENAVIDEANKKLQDQADLQVKINEELRKGEYTILQTVTALQNVTDLYAKQADLKKSITEQDLQSLKAQRDALLAENNPSGNGSQIKALDSQILEKEKELAQFKADAAKETLQATKDQLKAVTDTIESERIKALEFAKNSISIYDQFQFASGAAALQGAAEGREAQLEFIRKVLSSAGYKPGQIPGFRSGVEGFDGGLAKVHAGEIVQAPSGASAYINKPEVLMNLPRGSNVYTANQVKNSSNPLLTEIKGLRSDLKNTKGIEQTFNLALRQDDALEHMRNLQYATMRGRIN